MQRGAGNQAVARMLSRTVTLWNPTSRLEEPQTAEYVKNVMTTRIPEQFLPELDLEIAFMVGPDFKHHYASDLKLYNGVFTRLQDRYKRSVTQSHPRAVAMVGEAGIGVFAWATRTITVPDDLETLLGKVGPLVEDADMKNQFKDVFGSDEGMSTKLGNTQRPAWIKGKQSQLDGLMAELRVAGRTSADQLAPQEKMRFGKKFSTPSPTNEKEEVSVKADLSYTDSAGVLWFVEIAEGVEGLRKKVTRLDAHQRAAYQTVAKAQTRTTRLKYVCPDADGWMKLCNVDKKQPAPVSALAEGGWLLDLGNESLSTKQLELAAHHGKLLYGNYTAGTIGKKYRTVWTSLAAFAADTNPVSTFTSVTSLQPDLKVVEGTKTEDKTVG